MKWGANVWEAGGWRADALQAGGGVQEAGEMALAKRGGLQGEAAAGGEGRIGKRQEKQKKGHNVGMTRTGTRWQGAAA